MKKTLVFSLALVLIMPLCIFGCDVQVPTEPTIPDEPLEPENVTIEITCDDFASVSHVGKVVDLIKPGLLTVTLCSNPTTGFQWDADPAISAPSVIAQDSYEFVQPLVDASEMIAGAPGKDVWVFKSLNEGTATISFSYSRPWEGGEKDVWTLVLEVTVYQ